MLNPLIQSRANNSPSPPMNRPLVLRRATIACLLFNSCCAPANAWQPPAVEDTRPLPRLPVLSIEEAQDNLEIVAGLEVKLVASEPLVADPVAFCFDARQRLWVVEMRGYSERRDDGLGRVRRLEDRDGDGVMDHSEIIVDRLQWPTAIACYRDGVIVATAPDLLFVEQTGENNPPRIEKLCSGFGLGNVQGLVNSLRWGLDLRLHGATSSSGASIVGLGHDQDRPLTLGRRDFAIDMDRRQLMPVDGGGQHGMMIDAWGDKYVCSNSDHLQQVILLPGRTSRATRYSSEPLRRRSIAADGPQAEVYRASPVEPWRILRTQLRVSGQVPGLIEGGGRAAGYFTGATGVWIYEGDCFGPGGESVALVCDVGSNLIHRKRLTANGLFNVGTRIDREHELLRSRDTWFRPVQLASGPDGGIYIADMTREVIEHPLSLPPIIKSQVDLNSGNELGRIWKIVPASNKQATAPVLANKTDAELVTLIDTRNTWQRRSAARLLAERASFESLDELGQVVSAGHYPEGRLQALATMVYLCQHQTGISKTSNNSLRKSVDQAIKAAVQDPHPRVRQRAIEYTATLRQLAMSGDVALFESLMEDESIHVRFQLAHDASALIDDAATRLRILLRIAEQDADNDWVRWAVEGSLGETAVDFLKQMLAADSAIFHSSPASQSAWLKSVCFQAVNERRCHQDLVVLLTEPSRDRGALIGAVAEAVSGIAPDDGSMIKAWVIDDLTAHLRATIDSQQQNEMELMGSMMTLLRWADREAANTLMVELLLPRHPTEVQLQAIDCLTGFDRNSSEVLVQNLAGLSPAVAQRAVDRLSQSQFAGQVLHQAIEGGTLSANLLPEKLRLQWSIGEAENSAASKPEMRELLARYLARLNERPDLEVGRQLFTKHCSACHQVGQLGNQIGPDLKSIVDKSENQILMSILDPNAEIDPKYLATQVITDYGQVFTGVVIDESEGRIRLGDNQGTVHEIRRDQIESLNRSSVSLMPAGLHEQVSPEQMSSLILFLKQP